MMINKNIFSVNLNRPEYNIKSKGFGSIFCHVINSIYLAENMGFTAFNVDIENIKNYFNSITYQGDSFDGGDYYYINHKNIKPLFSAHEILTEEKLSIIRKIANENLFLKKRYNDQAYEMQENIQSKNCKCAMHIRGTDKSSEIILPFKQEIFFTIDKLINESKSDHCYVETDDILYYELLSKSKYPCIFDFVNYSNKPKHFSEFNDVKQDIIKAKFLSTFEYFGYSFSNYSFMCMALGNKPIITKNISPTTHR